MSGIGVGHASESGSGTWIDKDGAVVFTIAKKNGAAVEAGANPMKFSWKDSTTLVMSVPKLDVGIPLRRR